MGDGDHALGGGDVRQLRSAGDDIADGVDAGLAGALHLVDFDEAAVELDAGAFETDVVGLGPAADGDQQAIRLDGFDLAVFKRHVEAHAGIGFLHAGRIDFRSGFDADAGFLEGAQEFLGDFVVFDGNDARQHLKHRDFAAEAMEAGGELDADRARAQHRHGLGNLREIQDFDVGEDALRVGLEPGEHARFRTGGQNDIARFQSLGATVRGVDFDAARTGQPRVALDPIDLVLAHEELDALGVLGDDRILALQHQRVIQARIVAADAGFLRVLDVAEHVGGVEEGLGGDAAHQQAGSAQPGVFFNDGGFQAVLSRANGRRISTGAAPDDDHVVGHVMV